MEIKGGVGNIGGRPAVVVDNRHLVAGEQQLLRHRLLRPVGVHHHQQGAGVGQNDSVLAGDKGLLVLGQGAQSGDHVRRRSLARLPDDVGGHPPLAGDGAHAGGRADTVQVPVLVAHNKDSGGVGHQLPQGVGHHPALHLGALLRLLAPAAVELKVKLVFDDRLVPATAQGHLQGQGGKLKQLLEGVRLLADADGQCGGQTGGVLHLVDCIQHGELPVLKLLEIALLKEEEIAVPVVFGKHPLGGGGPLVQSVVDAAHQGGFGIVTLALHDLLVIVQGENGQHRALCVILIPQLGQIGDIHPVGGGQIAAPSLLVGADHVAEHQKAALAQGHLTGALPLALHQPAGGEAGHRVGQLEIKQMLPLPCDLKKAVVGPDHLVALRPENNHGQGGIGHGILGGHVDIVRDILDILQNLLLPLGIAAAEVEVQRHHHHRLHGGQRPVAPRPGGQSKEHQADKIQPQAGLQQVGELFLAHTGPPFSARRGCPRSGTHGAELV